MKLCKDCKWSVHSHADAFRCECPKIFATVCLVTGDNETLYHGWCDLLRRDGWLKSLLDGSCGRSGRFWESKSIPRNQPSDAAYSKS